MPQNISSKYIKNISSSDDGRFDSKAEERKYVSYVLKANGYKNDC